MSSSSGSLVSLLADDGRAGTPPGADARRERTREALESFLTGVLAWVEYRKSRDAEQRHKSQLEAVKTCLQGANWALQKEVNGIAAAQGIEAMNDACRRIDRRLAWLQRLWWFFREHLDQRETSGMPGARDAVALLDAADDVVWSCYSPIVANASFEGLVTETASPPLPFLDPEVSPAATPATWVPPSLQRDAGQKLSEHLSKLPFSVVHLPLDVVRSPWWLVFTGHEIGHCVQMELGWRAAFAKALRKAVAAQDADLWEAWSAEVFADHAGSLSMGPEGLRALVEHVRAPGPSMRRREDRYPPSAVRVALCARMLQDNGCSKEDVTWALGGLNPNKIVEGDPVAERDMAQIDAVMEVLGRPLGQARGMTLKSLAGEVAFARVKGSDPPSPKVPVAATDAREIARWALGAWVDAESRDTPEERSEGRRAVAIAAKEALKKAHVPGSRAGDLASDETEHGERLAALLAEEEGGP